MNDRAPRPIPSEVPEEHRGLLMALQQFADIAEASLPPYGEGRQVVTRRTGPRDGSDDWKLVDTHIPLVSVDAMPYEGSNLTMADVLRNSSPDAPYDGRLYLHDGAGATIYSARRSEDGSVVLDAVHDQNQ